jgi:hypothetical protein
VLDFKPNSVTGCQAGSPSAIPCDAPAPQNRIPSDAFSVPSSASQLPIRPGAAEPIQRAPHSTSQGWFSEILLGVKAPSHLLPLKLPWSTHCPLDPSLWQRRSLYRRECRSVSDRRLPSHRCLPTNQHFSSPRSALGSSGRSSKVNLGI